MCSAVREVATKGKGREVTRDEAIMNLSYILVEYPETSARGKAVLVAIEALAKMEAIQKVVDMPMLWEQDDRRRYTKIVDIIRGNLAQEEEQCQLKDDTSNPFEEVIYDFFSELDEFKKRKEAEQCQPKE